MSIIEREHAVEAPAVTTREVLHRAADLIEEWGWDQGCYGMPHRHHDGIPRRYCLVGSVVQAQLDLGIQRRVASVYDFGGRPLVKTGAFVDDFAAVEWNDSPERTKADVVAKLREAAESA